MVNQVVATIYARFEKQMPDGRSVFGVFTRDYRHNTLNSQVTGFEFGKSVTLISLYLPLDQLIFVRHPLKIWKSIKEKRVTVWIFPTDSCYSPTVFGNPLYFSKQTALDEECQICDFWWGKWSSFCSVATQPVKVYWTCIQFPWAWLLNLEDQFIVRDRKCYFLHVCFLFSSCFHEVLCRYQSINFQPSPVS